MDQTHTQTNKKAVSQYNNIESTINSSPLFLTTLFGLMWSNVEILLYYIGGKLCCYFWTFV